MKSRPVVLKVKLNDNGDVISRLFSSLRECVKFLSQDSSVVSITHKATFTFPKELYDAIWRNLKDKDTVSGLFSYNGYHYRYYVSYDNQKY